jgi:hypothetical protein
VVSGCRHGARGTTREGLGSLPALPTGSGPLPQDPKIDDCRTQLLNFDRVKDSTKPLFFRISEQCMHACLDLIF